MNQLQSAEPARNQLCSCGSGVKYKHCCAKKSATPTKDYVSLLQDARHHAFQRKDFAAAEHCYRQVLILKPNNAEALAGVGQGLFWRHRRAEARSYMQKAAKVLLRQPEKTEVAILLDLAEQLQLWGELILALQLARAVLKRQPQHLAAQYALAASLHRLNHLDQAIAALQKLLKQDPSNASSQILMAVLEFDNKQAPQAALRLQNLLAVEKTPLQRARALLELSRVYDKLARFDEAFSAFTQAGELQRQLPANAQIDSDYIFKKIALYQQGFDDALLKRWRKSDFADDLPGPVFLIGFLRSGTTLTEQVLAAHSDIIATDENQLLNEVTQELERLTGIRADSIAALRACSLQQAQQLRQFYWQRAAEEYTPDIYAKVFVDKVALNSIETGLISVLFPDAKILFALRDPRDICLSCAMQAFSPTVATINLLSWQGIARQYDAVMNLWLSLRPRIGCEYLELRYEDTVTDFEAVFRQVFTFLGVEWQEQVSRYHQGVAGKIVSTPSFSAVSQPIYQSALARWRHYQSYYASVLPLLQPYIEAFGYLESDH